MYFLQPVYKKENEPRIFLLLEEILSKIIFNFGPYYICFRPRKQLQCPLFPVKYNEIQLQMLMKTPQNEKVPSH